MVPTCSGIWAFENSERSSSRYHATPFPDFSTPTKVGERLTARVNARAQPKPFPPPQDRTNTHTVFHHPHKYNFFVEKGSEPVSPRAALAGPDILEPLKPAASDATHVPSISVAIISKLRAACYPMSNALENARLSDSPNPHTLVIHTWLGLPTDWLDQREDLGTVVDVPSGMLRLPLPRWQCRCWKIVGPL